MESNRLNKRRYFLVDKKDRIIRYQCSQCDFSMINNRQEFLQHLEQEHIEVKAKVDFDAQRKILFSLQDVWWWTQSDRSQLTTGKFDSSLETFVSSDIYFLFALYILSLSWFLRFALFSLPLFISFRLNIHSIMFCCIFLFVFFWDIFLFSEIDPNEFSSVFFLCTRESIKSKSRLSFRKKKKTHSFSHSK